jgi:arsenite methyltransferase
MLALAEKYRQDIARRIGYQNVEFRKGRIQDLRLDLSLVDAYLAGNPIASTADLARFNAYCSKIKAEHPLIEDESVDLVLSNCVLNLVRTEHKEQLFNEMV